jgi:hypothetical protein
MDKSIQEMINLFRENIPNIIAEELVNVQPMPNNIDFKALAEHPL